MPVRDANQISYNADFVISAQETRQMHYLALDTNILINYLNTVRTLHMLLSASVDRLGLLILIPIKVIQGESVHLTALGPSQLTRNRD